MVIKPENVKYGWEFGVGPINDRVGPKKGEFITVRQAAIEEAWGHACPIPNKVMKTYGEEWTLARYCDCNRAFKTIVDMAAEIDFKLYYQLTDYTPRVAGEYHARLNKRFIPKDFWKEMPPLSTPWGYALPRILIEQYGRNNENGPRTMERIKRGEELLKEAVEESKTPIELMIRLADKVCGAEANTEVVLAHIMAKGILKEQGCKTMFREIAETIESLSPKLWLKYQEMLKDKKWRKKLVSPADLE